MKVEPTETKQLNLKDLTLDKSVQMRASMNRVAIIDYADAMEAGETFPPIVVYTKFGDKKWVSDGFHRVLARRRTKAKTIEAEVRHGGKRDAILYAAQSNRLHGVRMSNEDKRKAVITFLSDREWKKWEDKNIADACGVSASMVYRYRTYFDRGETVRTDERGRLRRKFKKGGQEKEYSAPKVDVVMDEKFKGEKCPYCGQAMPGNMHRARF